MSIEPTLEITFNDDCEDFKSKIANLVTNYPNLIFHAYNEWHYKEKKKAYKLKGGYSARMAPFALFKDNTHTIPFYSESDDCTVDNIKEILNRYCND